MKTRSEIPAISSRWETRHMETPRFISVTRNMRHRDNTVTVHYVYEGLDKEFSAKLGDVDIPDTFLFRFQRRQ